MVTEQQGHIMNNIPEKQPEMTQITTEKQPYMSQSLDKLFAALAKAQAEMPFAGENNNNPYFKSKYSSLGDLIKASRPVLTANGLCVMQQLLPSHKGAGYLCTILGHSSGQWIKSVLSIVPPKSDVQTLGSYITYLRRYSYASLIGVVSGQEDDDGEGAMERSEKTTTGDTVTTEQHDKLQNELKDHPDIAQEILKRLKIQRLNQVPKRFFWGALKWIEEMKKAAN